MNCEYRDWQLKTLTFLAGDYKQKLKAAYKSIMDKKNEYTCKRCAACCKLAVSEYSYTQLKQRAMRGDKFASDFVSVFVPYENEEDAKKLILNILKCLMSLLRIKLTTITVLNLTAMFVLYMKIVRIYAENILIIRLSCCQHLVLLTHGKRSCSSGNAFKSKSGYYRIL